MPPWLLVGYILLVPSFSQNRDCTGPELNAIQDVLNNVNWKTLAYQLNLQEEVDGIEGECNSEINKGSCYLREVVSRYIQTQPEESCDNTRRKIVKALEELHCVKKAGQLRGLISDSPPHGILDHSDDDSFNETPSTISDEEVEATRRHIKELEENEFPNIISNAVKDIENKVEFTHLRLSAVNLPGDLKSELKYFRKEIRDNMLAAKSVDEIFIYLSLHWDFLNYSLLEHLINQHASERVRKEMGKYVEKIRFFRRNTKLQNYFKTRGRIPTVDKEFRKMVTKHDIDCATATLEDTENFRTDINSEISLSIFALLFYSATCGSVEITWLVPESLVAHIQKSIKPSSPSMRNHNVTKLIIDGMIIYDNATENQISNESSTVEPLISTAISILVSVLIIVHTTLCMYLMDYEQSPVQPDKRQHIMMSEMAEEMAMATSTATEKTPAKEDVVIKKISDADLQDDFF